MEKLLPEQTTSKDQREVLSLLCKTHELEVGKTELQANALYKDNLLCQKDFIIQRHQQYRHLCEELIQQQWSLIKGRTGGPQLISQKLLWSCFSLASSHIALKTPDMAFQRGFYYHIIHIFVGFSGNLASSLGPSTLEAFCLFCRPQYSSPGTSRKTVPPVFPRVRGRNSGSSDGASLVDVQCVAGKIEFSPIPLNGDSPERGTRGSCLWLLLFIN